MEACDFYEAILCAYKTTLFHTQEDSDNFTSRDFNIISLAVL